MWEPSWMASGKDFFAVEDGQSCVVSTVHPPLSVLMMLIDDTTQLRATMDATRTMSNMFISDNTDISWKADRRWLIAPYLRSLYISLRSSSAPLVFLCSECFTTNPVPKCMDKIYAICRPIEWLPLIPYASLLSHLKLRLAKLRSF